MESFAREFRRILLGFSGVSLPRIGPALRVYVSAGLSPADIRKDLDRYLGDTGRTWRTHWRPDQGVEQAKYLVSMLTRARRAGYIKPPTDAAAHFGISSADDATCPHGALAGTRILAAHGVQRCPLCRAADPGLER